MTSMSCCRQNSTAVGETLDPEVSDWCIQTRITPASSHSRTMSHDRGATLGYRAHDGNEDSGNDERNLHASSRHGLPRSCGPAPSAASIQDESRECCRRKY